MVHSHLHAVPGAQPGLGLESGPGPIYGTAPRNVYWEVTTACDLACRHCRANAMPGRDPEELTTAEGQALLRDIKDMGSMVIITGGDPMKRPDLFDLIRFARGLGLAVGITPSTTPLLTGAAIARFRELGVAILGLSLDGPTAELHDRFRGISGTFDCALRVLAWAREHRLPVQVNTTVTSDTLGHLPALHDLLGSRFSPPVRRWSLFLLVPTGRGNTLGLPTAAEVEDLCGWIYELGSASPFRVSTVEAPHYRRYWLQRRMAEGHDPGELLRAGPRLGHGIRDGNGVVFVSHRGDVFPAGFLPYPRLGNVRDTPLTTLYRDSPHLHLLRDMDRLQGKCGRCSYRWVCGGSRARAYALTGDPMESDPLCAHEP